MEFGRLLVWMYLPPELIPKGFDSADFDMFFRTLGMAQVARELRMEDIEIGVNKGYVEAHPQE